MAERKHPPTSTPDADNRSRQLNPEHDAYWRSRGDDGRPTDSPVPVAPDKKQ